MNSINKNRINLLCIFIGILLVITMEFIFPTKIKLSQDTPIKYTVLTNSPIIRLIDLDGVEVGSLTIAPNEPTTIIITRKEIKK